MPKIRVVCAECGSANVGRDAWAVWDIALQDWELDEVFDQGYCFMCDEDARLVEVEVET